MESLIVFSFIAFAMAWVAGHAHVSYPLRLSISKAGGLGRVIVTLLECCGCISFWLGLAAHFLHLTPTPLDSWWKAAFFSAGSSLVLARFAGVVDGSVPEGGAEHDRS